MRPRRKKKNKFEGKAPLVELTVEDGFRGGIIRYLKDHLPDYSFTQISRWFEGGNILVNGHVLLKKRRVQGGEKIQIMSREKSLAPPEPEDIPLEILYEDEYLLVVNKPAGMTTHPAPGCTEHTLVNALLHHGGSYSSLNGSQAPGIVHRLDKDTSGLILIARNDRTHTALSRAIATRKIKRIYKALVWGVPEAVEGMISAPIGRAHISGRRYAVSHDAGKPARTRYRVIQQYGPISLIQLSLLSGRTHQVRLHMAHFRHPVLGDPDYCRVDAATALGNLASKSPELSLKIRRCSRQMLHASTLIFQHPVTKKTMNFTAAPPEDMLELLTGLEGLCPKGKK